MNLKELLPCGSIVRLKNAAKKLMIIGIVPQSKNVIYDYVACLYPEGYIDSKSFFLFNHTDISTVEHNGYIDEEAVNYRKMLEQLAENKEES